MSYLVENPEDRFSRDMAEVNGNKTVNLFHPRHEKTCLRGLGPGKTQTDLRLCCLHMA